MFVNMQFLQSLCLLAASSSCAADGVVYSFGGTPKAGSPYSFGGTPKARQPFCPVSPLLSDYRWNLMLLCHALTCIQVELSPPFV